MSSTFDAFNNVPVTSFNSAEGHARFHFYKYLSALCHRQGLAMDEWMSEFLTGCDDRVTGGTSSNRRVVQPYPHLDLGLQWLKCWVLHLPLSTPPPPPKTIQYLARFDASNVGLHVMWWVFYWNTW